MRCTLSGYRNSNFDHQARMAGFLEARPNYCSNCSGISLDRGTKERSAL